MEQVKKNMQECMAEFEVDEAAVKSNTVPDDKKCFHKCMKMKMGVMNEKGDLTIADYKTKHPEAKPEMVTNLETCAASSKKPDPCDTAKAITECMMKNWKKP